MRALRDHQQGQESEGLALGARWPSLGYVFTTPIGTSLDPRNCTRIVQDQCATAGLPAIRLHELRHGCVSVLLALGVPPPRTVMDIVGHSTLEMTMTVYGHVSLDDKRAALDQLGGLLDEEPRNDVCCHRLLSGPVASDRPSAYSLFTNARPKGLEPLTL
ncbi:tyrosine-type recombinase/integrase [Micromonospora chersina]|uniref:tyrosine-type recombinase/integrase n=1 Tax=Micromonospora chersina TaxID=47854 RepID=UPI0034030E66